MFNLVKTFKNARIRIKEDSCETLLWLVNIIPGLAGFSILKDKVSALFWIIHIPLLLYVYLAGCLVFLVKDAETPIEYIQNFTSLALLAFIMNINYWFLKKRPLLKAVVEKVREADSFARKAVKHQKEHQSSLRAVKMTIMGFQGINYLMATFVYVPHRMDVTSNSQYSMTPCVGMEQLTESPNRQICRAILCFQEISIMTVVLNFQSMLVFLIAHTSIMYQMMSYEILDLDSKVDNEENKKNIIEKLPVFVYRHVLVLDIVDNLKELYSVPIMVNFISNAICISLFFILPVNAWLSYAPIFIYCFIVFFLYCFLGQRLINASELFESAVYACGWEEYQLKERKAVYIMLQQAQRPVEILAGDLIPVNIYTFATTLQAMYKFVTVVKF